MGRLGKAVFIFWLLWVHLFFYRNLLERYAGEFEGIGLGPVARSILSAANGLLSAIGLA